MDTKRFLLGYLVTCLRFGHFLTREDEFSNPILPEALDGSLENNPCSSSNTIFDNFNTQPIQREININDSDWSPPDPGLYNRRKYTKKELREDLAGSSKTVDKPYPNNPYIVFEAQEERDNTMAADGNSSELNITSSDSANNFPVIAKKSRRVLNLSQLDNDKLTKITFYISFTTL